VVEPFADRLDGPADGVQEGGVAAWLVAAGVEFLDLLHRTIILRDDVLVIEEHEGQFSLAGCFLVGFKEAVETADRFLSHACRGAGTVENQDDFRQFWVGVCSDGVM
jgi:hypothetical protein